jgi:diphthamide synthase (EF-2-diphthine--ammonia ligase)
LGVFPLWKEDTRAIAREFIDRRFKAIICCTNDAHLTQIDVGRALDDTFFRGLPAGVDPCGENGEYHSFIYDGPIFRHPVAFEVGETVYRPLASASEAATPPTATRGFWFVDLIPA